LYAAAETIGSQVAARQAVVVTGGLTGVMEAAAKGAKAAGGVTIGILPGLAATDANPDIDHAIVTGLGEARNILIVRTASVLIAVGGGYGTLSEIAFALRLRKPVVGLDTWDVAGPIVRVRTPQEAITEAFALLNCPDLHRP
jgi:hypothetical protein